MVDGGSKLKLGGGGVLNDNFFSLCCGADVVLLFRDGVWPW